MVDFEVLGCVFKAFYTEGFEAFIVASSDSDSYTLCSQLPKVNYLFLVERIKCGDAMFNTLKDNGISYAYMEDIPNETKRTLLDIVMIQKEKEIVAATRKLIESSVKQTILDDCGTTVPKGEVNRYVAEVISLMKSNNGASV